MPYRVALNFCATAVTGLSPRLVQQQCVVEPAKGAPPPRIPGAHLRGSSWCRAEVASPSPPCRTPRSRMPPRPASAAPPSCCDLTPAPPPACAAGRPDGGCGKDSTARTAKCTSLYMHPPSSCGVGAAAVHRPTSAKGRRRRGHTNGALRQGGSRMESPLGQSRRGAHLPARCATRRLVDVGEGWLKLRIRCAQ